MSSGPRRALVTAFVAFAVTAACAGEILVPASDKERAKAGADDPSASDGVPSAGTGAQTQGGRAGVTGGRRATGGRTGAAGRTASGGGSSRSSGGRSGIGGALGEGGNGSGRTGPAPGTTDFWPAPYDPDCTAPDFDLQAFQGQANMSGNMCASCHIPGKLTQGAKRGWVFAGSIRISPESLSPADGVEHVEIGVRSPASAQVYRTCTLPTGEFFFEIVNCAGCIDWGNAEIRIRSSNGERVVPENCQFRTKKYQGVEIGGLCNTCHSPAARPTPLGYITPP